MAAPVSACSQRNGAETEEIRHMNTDSNTMTRREAIKRMGLTLAGGLLASGGLSALASCTKEKKTARCNG